MTICFAERNVGEMKDPRVFQMLGLQHVTAFAQVSFFYTVGAEPWDTWLNDANEFRDLAWLAEQPEGRRALHLGGHFAHDTFPVWHGREASKIMAAEVRRRFPGEEKPIDFLYLDHEMTKSGEFLRESLATLLPLCKRAANFNFYHGPGYWGGTGNTADPKDLDNRRKTPIDKGGIELYGGAREPLRFKRAIRLNPGCVPIGPVCSRDTDWSKLCAFSESIAATQNLLRYWHAQDPDNRVCMVAPYMLAEREGPESNYWHRKVVGPGRSLEYLFKFDRMIGELEEA